MSVHARMRSWRIAAPLFERARLIRQTESDKPTEGSIPHLRDRLHPLHQHLKVARIIRESPTTKTYLLQPADSRTPIAPFQAGAYLSVEVDLGDGTVVSRPYSISNTPDEARKENAYAVTVRRMPEAFISREIDETWTVGRKITTSDPQGFFTFEPLRDSSRLVFVAGGSGITPFRSLVGDILTHEPRVSISMIHGASRSEELLFDDDFRLWENAWPERFRRITVLSESDGEPGSRHRRGFISASILAGATDHWDGESAYDVFVCGPPAMHGYIDDEAKKLARPPRHIRREDYGDSGSPSDGTKLALTVRYSGCDEERTIAADPGETVLVALERAGITAQSSCRTGECGLCRGRLLTGEVEYPRPPKGLRQGDRVGGYFHPCAAMPRTDIMMEIPAEPAERRTKGD